MNRTVDSTAAHQSTIGRIHDSINDFLGDITHR